MTDAERIARLEQQVSYWRSTALDMASTAETLLAEPDRVGYWVLRIHKLSQEILQRSLEEPLESKEATT